MLLTQPWEVVRDMQRLRDLALAFSPPVAVLLQSFKTRGPVRPRYRAFVDAVEPTFAEAAALVSRYQKELDFPVETLAKARRWDQLKCPRMKMGIVIDFAHTLMILMKDVEFPNLLEVIAREAC